MYNFHSNIMFEDESLADEPNISENKGDEILPVLHAFSYDSEDRTVAVPSTLKTLWETKKLEKIVDQEGHKIWQCHFLWSRAVRVESHQGLASCHWREREMFLFAKLFHQSGELCLLGFLYKSKQ
jgi:hypothetical protein